MRRILTAITISATIACSSPTAPTPPPVAATPPVVVAPPVSPPVTLPPPNPLLNDPRFSLAFYRQFALNGYESPASLQPLRRFTAAPRIYLRTTDERGTTIDAQTLDETATAIISVTGALTGAFGIAGLERGAASRVGQPGWITVTWRSDRSQYSPTACAEAFVGSDELSIFYRNGGSCRCPGGGAIKPLIVKHELGHVLGFWHTDSLEDLMHNGGHSACDMQPSAREQFHARIAYGQPNGSFDPR